MCRRVPAAGVSSGHILAYECIAVWPYLDVGRTIRRVCGSQCEFAREGSVCMICREDG